MTASRRCPTNGCSLIKDFKMKTLKVILVLALVFVAGAAGGVVATRIAVRRFVTHAIADPDFVRLRVERDLARELDLDRRQKLEMSVTLRQSHERIRALREQFDPQ